MSARSRMAKRYHTSRAGILARVSYMNPADELVKEWNEATAADEATRIARQRARTLAASAGASSRSAVSNDASARAHSGGLNQSTQGHASHVSPPSAVAQSSGLQQRVHQPPQPLTPHVPIASPSTFPPSLPPVSAITQYPLPSFEPQRMLNVAAPQPQRNPYNQQPNSVPQGSARATQGTEAQHLHAGYQEFLREWNRWRVRHPEDRAAPPTLEEWMQWLHQQQQQH